jgi:hypothetical protein
VWGTLITPAGRMVVFGRVVARHTTRLAYGMEACTNAPRAPRNTALPTGSRGTGLWDLDVRLWRFIRRPRVRRVWVLWEDLRLDSVSRVPVACPQPRTGLNR